MRALAAALLAALFVLLPSAVSAQTTFVVTTTADCTGCGSLRDALNAAKALNSSARIDLTGVSGRIHLENGYAFTQWLDFVGSGNITITGSPGIYLSFTANIIERPTVSGVSFGDIEIRLVDNVRWVTATDNVLTPSTRLFLSGGGGVLVGSTTQRVASLNGPLNDAGVVRFDTGGRLFVGETGLDSSLRLSADGAAGAELHKTGSGTMLVSGNQNGPAIVVDQGILVLQPSTDGLLAFVGSVVNNSQVELRTTLGSGSQAGCCASSSHITGTGSVHKWGAGEWQLLFGRSNHTGGTVIHEGSLTAGTRNLSGAILNNSIFNIRQSGAYDGAYAGLISGTGRVRITEGTVRFNTVQTYSGGTEIAAGFWTSGASTALALDVANVLDPNGQMTITNGRLLVNASQQIGNLSGTSLGIVQLGTGTTLTVNQSGNTTYAGQMFGGGSLVKAGTGTLTLVNPTFYTGGTTVLGGTLAGTTASVQGTIVNNATISFNQTFFGIQSGAISGTGHVIFGGGATYLLTGNNTYTGGTTLNGGTLRGSSISIQGDILNFGQVTFEQPVGGTYTGSMSGTGSVTKTGAGTLVMTGSHSYTGGTTVLQGTLQGTTSSLQGNIANSSTVAFDQSFSGTFSGAISGAGSVVKSGSGTVTLAGAQSYTGGTSVVGGTLAGDTASLRGTIVNDASLEFVQGGDGAFSGFISGTGRVIKSGGGTVFLTGANAYSGGTVLRGGVLNAAADPSLGAAGGGLTFDGGTLQFGGAFVSSRAISLLSAGTIDTNGFDGSLSGSISGNGSLTKSGRGTLFLTGAATHTGGTTVAGGVLSGSTRSLQGRITNNALVVFDQNAAGTYAGVMSGGGSVLKLGTGVLTYSGAQTYTGLTEVAGGGLVLGGDLGGSLLLRADTFLRLASQANVPTAADAVSGAVGIGGDLFLSRGSTYQLALTAGGGAATLDVKGTAAIDGATLQIDPSLAGKARIVTSPIIRALRLEGGFGAVTGLGGLFDAFLVARNNELQLHLISTTVDFATFASSANGSAVGTALSAPRPAASTDLAYVLRELRAMATDAELAAALDEVAGSDHASIAAASLFGASEISDVIGLRFLGGAGPWVQATGSSISLDESVDPAAATSKAFGALGGYDWHAGRHGRIGLAAGYGRGAVRAFRRRNDVNDAVYRASAYGEAGNGRWFVSGIGSIARHEIEGGRSMSFTARLSPDVDGGVLFGGVDRTASFALNELELAGTVESGVRASAFGFELRPSAGLQIARLTRSAFDETGAESLDLSFGKQSVNSETLRLRLSAARGFGRVTPRFDVRYARELGDRDVALDAAIAGAAFEIAAFRLPRHSVSSRAGFGAAVGRARVSVDYTFTAAAGQRQHLVSVGVGR